MKINIKKAVISGIIAGFVLALVQLIWMPVSTNLLSLIYPNVVPWSFQLDASLIRILGFNFVEGIIFAFIFAIIFSGIPGKGIMKGLNYAFLLFFANTVIGVGFAYVVSPFPLLLVAAQLLIGLIQLLAMGAAIAIAYESTFLHFVQKPALKRRFR